MKLVYLTLADKLAMQDLYFSKTTNATKPHQTQMGKVYFCVKCLKYLLVIRLMAQSNWKLFM